MCSFLSIPFSWSLWNGNSRSAHLSAGLVTTGSFWIEKAQPKQKLQKKKKRKKQKKSTKIYHQREYWN